MDSNWRPENWDIIRPFGSSSEDGASAIIPYIVKATLKEVGEWLKPITHLRYLNTPDKLYDGVDALLRGEMPEG